MYAVLTLKLGIQPDYVLDRMEMYEAKSLLKYSYYKNMEDWEQTRLISFITAQVNSSKKLKINDIIKFQWDENPNDKKNGVINEQELQRLKQKAQNYINNKNITNNGD